MAKKSQPLSVLLAKEKPEVLQEAKRQAEDMLLDLLVSEPAETEVVSFESDENDDMLLDLDSMSASLSLGLISSSEDGAFGFCNRFTLS